MRIAIIGTGKMGRGFATALAPKHEVIVGSRDPDRAKVTATKTGAAAGTTYSDAARDADVVILTVPWNAMDETLVRLGALNGTVVVDVSFPYAKKPFWGRARARVTTGLGRPYLQLLWAVAASQ